MTKILEIKNLSRNFDGLQALKDVRLQVERGSIVGLAGPNGAGKTTLFNLISGFIPPSSGRVYFDGKDVTDWTVSRRVRAGITRTFQESRVFPRLTVRENVLTGRYSARDRRIFDSLPPNTEGVGTSVSDAWTPVKWILEVTHLQDYGEKMASTLSYGYRQRLELAIAVASDPKLLLLDEPFSGTHDSDLQELAGLLNILKGAGLTVILVEHDIASVANVADRLVYMEGGRVIIPNG